MEKQTLNIGTVKVDLFKRSEFERHIDFTDEEKALIYYNSALITLYDFISSSFNTTQSDDLEIFLEIAEEELTAISRKNS